MGRGGGGGGGWRGGELATMKFHKFRLEGK